MYLTVFIFNDFDRLNLIYGVMDYVNNNSSAIIIIIIIEGHFSDVCSIRVLRATSDAAVIFRLGI